MDRIAVQEGLKTFKDYLSNKGYSVEVIKNNDSFNNFKNFDAVVLSGMNKDFLGIQDTKTRVPVIDATGMTPEDVYNQLSKELQ